MTLPVQETYDRLAPVYDRRWAFYTEETLKATLAGLDPGAGARVLDIGAGTGELARRLLEQRPGVRVVELDLSRAMLLRGLPKSLGHQPALVQGTAARLPFRSGAFDLVVCSNSFHHFDAPRSVLAEMRRVLRPGGRLTLTDWCDDYLSCKLCALYLHMFDRSFHRAYSLRDCHGMLQNAEFEVIEHRRFKIDWIWGLMRFDARARGGDNLRSFPRSARE